MGKIRLSRSISLADQIDTLARDLNVIVVSDDVPSSERSDLMTAFGELSRIHLAMQIRSREGKSVRADKYSVASEALKRALIMLERAKKDPSKLAAARRELVEAIRAAGLAAGAFYIEAPDVDEILLSLQRDDRGSPRESDAGVEILEEALRTTDDSVFETAVLLDADSSDEGAVLSFNDDFAVVGAAESTMGGESSSPRPASPPPRTSPIDASVPIEVVGSLDDKSINVWVAERLQDPELPLSPNETYTACLNVGEKVLGALVPDGKATIPLADVPEEGLQTIWIVTSSNVELSRHADDVIEIDVVQRTRRTTKQWVARFDLHIPRNGNSTTRKIKIRPLTKTRASIRVVILTSPRRDVYELTPSEVYRALTFDLNVTARKRGRVSSRLSPGTELRETYHTPAAHLQLLPQHEWQAPPETLMVTLLRSLAFVHGTAGDKYRTFTTDWVPTKSVLEPLIQEIQTELNKLRISHQAYFDDLENDQDVFLTQLEGRVPLHHWWTNIPSPSAVARFEQIARSPQLRVVAGLGHRLFDELFPQGSELRECVELLAVGARLDLIWMKGTAPEWISHVPWQLAYRSTPPLEGEPVNPQDFLGLRLRISYVAHEALNNSKALGAKDRATLACALYWGVTDETGKEALLHKRALENVGRGRFIPESTSDRRLGLLRYLKQPSPSPVALLYFYCQCRSGSGVAPVLRFGETSAPENLVTAIDLDQGPLADRPLVFINACDTSAGDAYTANELEQLFFRRDCRAFVGTECEVPIRFASRFATAFFYYLCRADDNGHPTSAGEAFVQARQFFWEEYRNIGSLFYNYVNQYELLLGTDEEVAELRKKHA